MNALSPLVSVVIPVYRPDEDLFRAAVRSILAQTLTELELIVVEDPSDRSAASVLDSFGDPRIRYIRNAERTSLPRQHNRGLAEARGRFLARFDSDDISHENRLQTQIEYLQRNPDVDVVGGAIRIIDETGRVLGCRHYPREHDQIIRAMHFYSAIANPALMFRREIFERFGGWDPERTLPAGDYEWFSRIAQVGARFGNVDDILVDYRQHSGSLKSRKTHDTVRATIEIKRRYWPAPLASAPGLLLLAERLLMHLPPSLVYRLFRAARFTRCHGSSP